MLTHSLRLGLPPLAVLSIGLVLASCSQAPPSPGPGTPFSLGGDSSVAGFTPTPTPFTSVPPKEGSPTAAQPTAPPSGSPSAGGGLDVSTVGNNLQFDKASLTAAAGSTVTVTFHNLATSASLQHNWTLVKAGTADEVSGAGLTAGAASDWIPTTDPNVLAHTKLVNGGQSQTITFQAPAAGTYSFICTFPGHTGTMHGDFVVQ